jgi:ABC-2 type transport system ATP-binding protein
MAEAEAVCDRVALIDRGRLIATETPRTLSRLVAQHERIDFEGAAPELQDQLRRLPGIASVTQLSSGALRAELLEAEAMAPALQLLVGAGITSIQTTRPSLEEVYVHIMGDRGLQVGV